MAPQDMSPATDDGHLNQASHRFAGAYSDSAEKLNEITKLLRHCGIERIVPPLPKIVVTGNQSAGKSSLIEAISKIKVPRCRGTTTRCPMEVILRSNKTEDWNCHIRVRFEDPEVQTGRALGTVDLATTQRPEEVTLFIRRAQLAVLNPDEDPMHFLEFDETQCEEYVSKLSFSKDMVVVEINNAEDDVTFIDLPGIISNNSNAKVYPDTASDTPIRLTVY